MHNSINIFDGRIKSPGFCDISDDLRFQRISVSPMDREETVTGILVSCCCSNSISVREKL